MSWTSLRIAPGLVRNTTRYATSGTWFDGSLVRFRGGHPEKWSGWQEAFPGYSMVGMCRSIHRHGDLTGKRWVSTGTSKKFYMQTDEAQYDVTPLDITVGPLPVNLIPPTPPAITPALGPITTTSGSRVVIITDEDHGHYPGQYVLISGVTAAVGGIPAAELGTTAVYPVPSSDPGVEHLITGWIDQNRFEITVPTTAATSSATGGGTTVTLSYVYQAGTDDVVAGGGWGRLAWTEEEWGDEPANPLFDQMGVWSHDNWGEDLIACANNGPIFYWRASTPSTRMIDIGDIPPGYLGVGAPGNDGNAPLEAQFIIVSHRDRHCLAFGCTMYNDPLVVAPMTFRWCSQETITNWDHSDPAGTAGDLPLSNGSKFIAGIATAREILVWTDQAMYSIQYVGPPLIYTAELLDRWSDICGLKAVCSFGGVVYWMGQSGFYSYTGRTQKLDCPIWDYVSVRLNREQMAKVYASSNLNHNEVIFFYPSNESGNVEIDSYASVNVVENLWSFGSLSRTAWFDLDALSPPLAAYGGPTNARLFQHDIGADDGTTSPPSAINAYIESGPIELSSEGSYDKGDRMMFIRRIMPDVTFRNITASSTTPQMNLVLKMMDTPGGGLVDTSSSQVQRSATIPVEQFNTPPFNTNPNMAHVRLRGRSMTLRAESNTVGSEWRLGIPRIDARTDGQR